MSTLTKLRRLPFRDGLLLTEAFLSLTFFRLSLLIFPVRKIVAWLGEPSGQPADYARSYAQQVHRVQWAVDAVSRHSPLEFVCFPQALAGLWMLKRRKIPSTLIYGVAKSNDNKLIAHTWLQVDQQIILGGDVAPQFTPVDLPR